MNYQIIKTWMKYKITMLIHTALETPRFRSHVTGIVYQKVATKTFY